MRLMVTTLTLWAFIVPVEHAIERTVALADETPVVHSPNPNGYRIYERSPTRVLDCSIVAVNFRDEGGARATQLSFSPRELEPNQYLWAVRGLVVTERHVVWISGWPHRVMTVQSHPTDRRQRWLHLRYDEAMNPQTGRPLAGLVLPLGVDGLLKDRDFVISRSRDDQSNCLIVKQWPSELRLQDAGEKLVTATAKPGEKVQIGRVSVLIKGIIPSEESRVGGPWVQLILPESRGRD